jgi:hypothetical protein
MNRRYGDEAAGAGELPAIGTGTPLGPCPSCGDLISIGTEPNPRDAGKPTRCLLHPIPFCHYFGATDADIIEREILKGEVPS